MLNFSHKPIGCCNTSRPQKVPSTNSPPGLLRRTCGRVCQPSIVSCSGRQPSLASSEDLDVTPAPQLQASKHSLIVKQHEQQQHEQHEQQQHQHQQQQQQQQQQQRVQQNALATDWARVVWKRLLKELASLPRAIFLMATVVVLSGLGTLIPQNKPYSYYMEHYPNSGPGVVLGFLTYDLVMTLGFDHIYTASYFYATLVVLAMSLAACTSTRQLPAVRVAQRWRFASQPKTLQSQGKTEVLPNAQLSELGEVLIKRGYQVFMQGKSLYGFKGLAGKMGPIGVHIALLLVLGGTAYSGTGGYKGNVICPEGSDFVISEHIRAVSPIATRPGAADSAVHVNGFKIDYRPDGSVAQFYSDLSLFDEQGAEAKRQTISVNQPFRYGGVTMYQTDWSLAAVTLRVQPADSPDGMDNAEAFALPLASMEGKPGISGRLWATFLPAESTGAPGAVPRGVSVLARDPQSVVLYDGKGAFVGVRRPGSGKPITVEGLNIIVDRVIGSTGLEIKSDPGVPWVYAGFGGLMITTLVSYLSHSQVWALQEGQYVYVAGRTNRAQFAFDNEMDAVLEAVPERPQQ